MFPAILYGKRAIDRGVVTLLNDRLNAVSMATEVQRLLQQGHDEWYLERRDLYQTLLFQAHSAGSAPSQRGILPYAKSAGTYTPPLPPTPLPTARVLRRAHMIMEMEKMPVYRAAILRDWRDPLYRRYKEDPKEDLRRWTGHDAVRDKCPERVGPVPVNGGGGIRV
ncbi:uncharacterized protein LOC144926549 [Branchiostoma floridae x Branchiostoma belcheri]